ncbi:MAG TPA: DUF2600 family protein, partial [Thermoleophilaceae bacterium]
MQTDTTRELAHALAFGNAARRYWFSVFPLVRRELKAWRTRAGRIPDARLRGHALCTHDAKSAHSEGAAAFAVLAQPQRRQTVVRALVAFQGMYDYLDTLSEQRGPDLFANGAQLHSALVTALDLDAVQPDYYAYIPDRDDGGYLRGHVETCRAACAQLPSFPLVAGAVRHAAYRCMVSQGLNHAL